jgi:hypothetical protein
VGAFNRYSAQRLASDTTKSNPHNWRSQAAGRLI